MVRWPFGYRNQTGCRLYWRKTSETKKKGKLIIVFLALQAFNVTVLLKPKLFLGYTTTA